MTIQQDPGADQGGAATTRTVRATSATSRIGSGPSATVTAELPTVRGPAGTPVRHAPGVSGVRRQSAPVVLRIVVWLLALVLLVVIAGAVVADVRPDALSVLRHTVTPQSAASNPGGASASTTTAAATFQQVSSSATTVTYSVPAASYDLVITVAQPTFVEGHSPATASSWAFARTIAASKPTTIAITGSTTFTAFKTPSSVRVESNGQVLGSVAHPKLGVTYTFEPSTAKG